MSLLPPAPLVTMRIGRIGYSCPSVALVVSAVVVTASHGASVRIIDMRSPRKVPNNINLTRA
jgi:hypothetical protein